MHTCWLVCGEPSGDVLVTRDPAGRISGITLGTRRAVATESLDDLLVRHHGGGNCVSPRTSQHGSTVGVGTGGANFARGRQQQGRGATCQSHCGAAPSVDTLYDVALVLSGDARYTLPGGVADWLHRAICVSRCDPAAAAHSASLWEPVQVAGVTRPTLGLALAELVARTHNFQLAAHASMLSAAFLDSATA